MAINPAEIEETASGPAHPDAVRDFWLQTVKPLANSGRLDKLPTVRGTSARGRDIARTQTRMLTRSVFSMPDGYDRIFRKEDA